MTSTCSGATYPQVFLLFFLFFFKFFLGLICQFDSFLSSTIVSYLLTSPHKLHEISSSKEPRARRASSVSIRHWKLCFVGVCLIPWQCLPHSSQSQLDIKHRKKSSLSHGKSKWVHPGMQLDKACFNQRLLDSHVHMKTTKRAVNSFLPLVLDMNRWDMINHTLVLCVSLALLFILVCNDSALHVNLMNA